MCAEEGHFSAGISAKNFFNTFRKEDSSNVA
jgi:hypothetical protein